MASFLKENVRYYESPELLNSQHALMRKGQRGISQKQVALAYRYGRVIHARWAIYHVI